MTIVVTDDNGKEARMKANDDLAKVWVEDGFEDRERFLEIITTLSSWTDQRAVIDMNEVAQKITGSYPADTVTVRDMVTGSMIEVDIDMEEVDPEEDIDTAFGSFEVGDGQT